MNIIPNANNLIMQTTSIFIIKSSATKPNNCIKIVSQYLAI